MKMLKMFQFHIGKNYSKSSSIDKNKQKNKIDMKQVTRGKDIGANVVLHPGDYVIVEESLF